MGAPDAVVVAVGNELLLGRTVDTNGAWLGRKLEAMGFRALRRAVVADRDGDIRRALLEGVADAELVVLTGGLGPTSDDRTREAVAEELGRTLHLDRGILTRLTERFRRRGFSELPPANVRQAMVPDGARVLPNPVGTAPGLLLDVGGSWVALLPGIPTEMKSIFEGVLAARLRAIFGDRLRPLMVREIHTTGISESVLAEVVARHLPDDAGTGTVAFLPDLRGVDIRLAARDMDEPGQAERWLARMEDALAPALADFTYPRPSGGLEAAIGERLAQSGKTLATAESCTGGLIAKRLTDVPGSSRYFLGGVIAYSNEAKVEQLGVGRSLLVSHGAVSEEVARAMAAGAVGRFDADVGVGITGIAGPGGGTSDKPVGTVWYAAAVGGSVQSRHQVFPGTREAIRERSAQAVLAFLLRLLEGS